MGFSEKYLKQFHEVADLICTKYDDDAVDFVIGKYSACHYPPETIIEVMEDVAQAALVAVQQKANRLGFGT